jgi:hypothetical protein
MGFHNANFSIVDSGELPGLRECKKRIYTDTNLNYDLFLKSIRESSSEQNRGRKDTAGVSICSENVVRTLFWLMVVLQSQIYE